jgi:hypothetical protein
MFLAQLIAMAQRVPQTRMRRRSDAGNTADLYDAAAAPRRRPAVSRLA